jgi:hypothetical protein
LQPSLSLISNKLAALQSKDAMLQLGYLRQIMTGNQKADSNPVELLKQSHDLARQIRVQITSWLVSQDNRGLIHYGRGNTSALLLAT